MIRLLLLFHRYLGIAVGVLMSMWCVSGVVMMYVSYPALDESSRLQHLAPIVWRGCCQISAAALADTEAVGGFSVQMLAGRPVLNLQTPLESADLIDLTTGAAIDAISSAEASRVAQAYAGAAALTMALRPPDLISEDQWTVSDSFDAERPMYRFRLGDRRGTQLYVSSTTGEAVQITTARARGLNWLGSVPHWLYFTGLRRRAMLWSDVVIVASLIGCFLAATGLYIGVRQLLHRPAGRWSPYRGFNLWHHLAGVLFGVLTLSWVLSGLLSMNPWGWLEGASAQPERARLRGPEPSGAQLKDALKALAASHPSAVVAIESAPLHGRLYVIASAADGARVRLDASGAVAPLSGTDLSYIAQALGAGVAVPPLMSREDSYYFSHQRERVQLPVYRLVVRDGPGMRYYVDPVSGALVAKIDRGARGYRWWHEGLHRMDFVAAIRSRPQWDALMLLLMSGVTLLCVTETYLGYRRLAHGGT